MRSFTIVYYINKTDAKNYYQCTCDSITTLFNRFIADVIDTRTSKARIYVRGIYEGKVITK